MSKNISEIPYTEIVERAQKLARVGENSLEKIRGIVQDVYAREIPAKFDWNFLLVTSSFLTIDEYHQGSITMNTGDTVVQFTSDAVMTAGVVGRKFKPSSNDAVYDITLYSNATSISINPSLQGATNLSGASYSIYQPYYPLAGDFDRFPKPGGVYSWAGGRKQILEEEAYRVYINEDYQSTATTPQKTRLFGTDTMGNQLVELVPAPRTARVYGYDYFKRIKPLYDTTAGTLSSVAANGTTIIGNTNTHFTDALTDGTFYIRIDNFGVNQDSTWYRVVSVLHDSQLTIATAFANSAITSSANYTISRAPEMPARMHIGVLYGALRSLTIDQNDPNAAFYHAAYAQVLSDAKKIYVSRPYSQEVTGIFEDYRYRR